MSFGGGLEVAVPLEACAAELHARITVMSWQAFGRSVSAANSP